MLRSPAVRLITLLGLTAGCGPTGDVELVFRSEAIHAVVRKVEVSLFAEVDDMLPSCDDIDPRGQPAVSPADRLGISASYQGTGPLEDSVLEIPDIAAGRYTLVIEAYSPTCESVSSVGQGEPFCQRLSSSEPTVMRGYYCNPVALEGGGIDFAANLETFTEIGSTMRVPLDFPVNAKRYDEGSPLFVEDSEPALDTLVIQLLDSTSDEVDEVKVNYSVVQGRGTFVEPMPILTAEDPLVQDNGLARATLRAGFKASADGGRIAVQAHAPGFEDSPLTFIAHAVAYSTLATDFVPMPPGFDLDEVAEDFDTLIARDLDGDGRVDFITAHGYSDHRLAIAYGAPQRTYRVATTPARPQRVRALEVAKIAGGRKMVIASVAEATGRREDTTGIYFPIAPGFELWPDLDQPPNGAALTAVPALATELSGRTIEHLTIHLAAGDVDGDGVDEIAASRCTHLDAQVGGNDSRVICYGSLNDDTDSEVAVIRSTDTFGVLDLVAARRSEGNDGGFREVHFGDISGDGTLDLGVVGGSVLKGLCGRRAQQPDFAFADTGIFQETIAFGNGYSFAFGDFDDKPGVDAVAAGPYRASSAVGGLKVLLGNGCDFDEGPPALSTNRRAASDRIQIRAADVNGDGLSDVLLLHRDEKELALFLGGGQGRLAAGPVLKIPSTNIGSFDVGTETVDGKAEVVIGIALLDRNELQVLRYRHP